MGTISSLFSIFLFVGLVAGFSVTSLILFSDKGFHNDSYQVAHMSNSDQGGRTLDKFRKTPMKRLPLGGSRDLNFYKTICDSIEHELRSRSRFVRVFRNCTYVWRSQPRPISATEHQFENPFVIFFARLFLTSSNLPRMFEFCLLLSRWVFLEFFLEFLEFLKFFSWGLSRIAPAAFITSQIIMKIEMIFF